MDPACKPCILMFVQETLAYQDACYPTLSWPDTSCLLTFNSVSDWASCGLVTDSHHFGFPNDIVAIVYRRSSHNKTNFKTLSPIEV